MTINGLFIVPKLRAKKYVTCIDSLQDAYGQTMGGLTYLPSCIGDICWTAAVLSALGSSLSIVLDLDVRVSIIGSALIAIIYTLCGGMYSVAFTDMIQITFIFGGLWLAIPFMIFQSMTGLVRSMTRSGSPTLMDFCLFYVVVY